MKLRYPAVPLVTHTPYLNLWSFDDVPNRIATRHWTGKPQPLTGVVELDGHTYNILGEGTGEPMKTVSVTVEACATTYVLECPQARVTMKFLSPLLLDDLRLLSRPVSYLSVKAEGLSAPAKVSFTASDALCLDVSGESPVVCKTISRDGFRAATMENSVQKPLNRSGDDVRIDWGTFYLALAADGAVQAGDNFVSAAAPLKDGEEALFAVGYDEKKCIQYFGADLDPLWKKYDADLPAAIGAAFSEYETVAARCDGFHRTLSAQAVQAGGEQYAQLLALAYRQVIAAHCLCEDEEGELLFISKECFSNGCAATADVSYPSIPLFLLYRPDLIFAMMRPLMKYAASSAWPFDFAPHDAGQYPLLNGQVYSNGTDPDGQMPVEECGNLLLMTTAATLETDDDSFADKHWGLLTKWAEYLLENGLDPENQLCTDDFAGHLAHNCNLSIKAILGIAGYGLLKTRRGEDGGKYLEKAREMAKIWAETAKNGDGTFRLAFDRPDTFSLKYNAVWDGIFGTRIFPEGLWNRELRSYLDRLNPYGVPLDNRAGYTKSDWEVWVACMMQDKAEFERVIARLWAFYNETPDRVPMGDWYETAEPRQYHYGTCEDGRPIGFQNRTVQGGLFMKLYTFLRRT